MSVLFILIPMSLLMGICALLFFAQSVNRGDFEERGRQWSEILELKDNKK